MSCHNVGTDHPQAFHTGGNTLGRGGFGDLKPLDILNRMQARYGIPSAQEEDDATVRFDLPIIRDDPHRSHDAIPIRGAALLSRPS